LTLAAALFGDLVFLPALLRWFAPQPQPAADRTMAETVLR
jgi:hypothetical protein